MGARELFKSIMKSQLETGMPYIFFKDRANEMNHILMKGMIAMEIFVWKVSVTLSLQIQFQRRRRGQFIYKNE